MNTSQKRIKCFRVNKENQAWSRCPLHKAAAALFVRYARQAAAVLARAVLRSAAGDFPGLHVFRGI